MTDTQGRKLNYHLKSNKNNLDKSNPQILTSSPTIDHKLSSKSHFNNLNNLNKLDKKLIVVQNLEETDEEIFKNTIQSMNDRDNVNYLIESSNDNNGNFKREVINNQKIFKTSVNDVNNFNINKEIHNKMNNKMILNLNNTTSNNSSPINNFKDLILNDRDEIYIKSTEKLLKNLKSSIDYFKEVPQELSVKNNDLKEVAVKMLKDELDKTKSEKEIILNENKKLKEKIKIFMKNNNSNININTNNTNNSLSKSNQNISNTISYLDENNVPVNKVIESFLKLQVKFDELEKENTYLKTENEDLNKKLTVTKKFITEDKDKERYSPYNKSRPGTKLQNINNSRRKSSNEMETLIKEQLKCMQKMLYLVQDENSVDRRNNQDNEYLQLESEMHFEESCNITNMTSNSNDYYDNRDNLNSLEKDFFDHRSSISKQKMENIMKSSDKVKVRENVIDEIPVADKNINIKKSNNFPSMNSNAYKNYYFNKDQTSSTRVRNINSNSQIMNLNNYSKSKNKNGGNLNNFFNSKLYNVDFSHRINHK